MAFCSKCGAQVPDGVQFCTICGNAAQPAAAQQTQSQQPYGDQPYAYQPPVVPGAPQQAEIRDAQENKTMAILSYILFFIPLLTGAHKKSPFVKFHVNQGTALFIVAVALSIALAVISSIITGILTATLAWGTALAVAGIFSIIWLVYGVGISILAIVGIINAVGGKMKPLPIVGKFNIIK